MKKAHLAVQTTCRKFYNHQYYLTLEEQAKYEPEFSTLEEAELATPSPSKKPCSADDYKSKYQYVLLDKRTVSDFKCKKSLHQEIQAAQALGNKKEGTQITLHYDTMSRSKVDGEWPSLTLNFLKDDKQDCKMYHLRALSFAFEDRDQIVKLILETYERLATGTGGNKSSKELWENIYAYITDAASKNLKVEYEVSKKLGAKHVPIHLLCKSHTCERLDKSCINILVKIEQQLKMAEMITNRQPNLQSFIQQSKSIVLCVITALLRLVSQEEIAKPTSLAKDFGIILEEDNVTKCFSLYKEQQFTKLGYTADSVIDCIPKFQLISETINNNSLVEACCLYLENDYNLAALKT